MTRLWPIATLAIQQESVSLAPQDTDWIQPHLLKLAHHALLESPIVPAASVTISVPIVSDQTFSETIFADSVARLWPIATLAIQQESVSLAPQDTDWIQPHLLKLAHHALLESPIVPAASVTVSVPIVSDQTFSETIFADSVARLWLIATPAIQQESVSLAPQDTDWIQPHLPKLAHHAL